MKTPDSQPCSHPLHSPHHPHPPASYEKTFTFDDLLLVPNHSEVIPHQVNTQTCLAKDKAFYLHTPILSSAMDTVTEHRMAKAMAQLGGLGILHRNLSIEKQCGRSEKGEKIRKRNHS